MNAPVDWFVSAEWTQLMKALLHSLWQGALVAVCATVLLRRIASPTSRYRLLLVSLGFILAATLVTWGVLGAPTAAAPFIPTRDTVPNLPVATSTHQPPVSLTTPWVPAQIRVQWTAWLALAWLVGTSLMLVRIPFQVVGAEKLRRSAEPLQDPRVTELMTQARRALNVTRRVKVAVTERLTSPSVVGVVAPTLVLPLSLFTTLSYEQIHLILLHELAHVRRGDYLANLFQLMAEALFFFNPAVWWISRQIRKEREACCDAVASEFSGAPADYTKTLLHVAERMLTSTSTAAHAFGHQRDRSLLTDRVRRLLVPGYCPSIQLTWRAMLAALLVGSAILGVLAVGAKEAAATNSPGHQSGDPSNSASVREVVFRFQTPTAAIPEGTVRLQMPTADGTVRESRAIENGQVRLLAPVDRYLRVEPIDMSAWWFNSALPGHKVIQGTGPMVIDIPTLPAGTIWVHTWDNRERGVQQGFRFTAEELAPAPLRDPDEPMRTPTRTVMYGSHWGSLTLPLGGTYQILGIAGPTYCLSEPITLTPGEPRVEVELNFPTGRTLETQVLDPNGQPLKDATVQVWSRRNGWRRSVVSERTTDAQGRIRIERATPNLADYEVRITADDVQLEWVRLDPTDTVKIIQLNSGRTLFGRVVDEETEKGIPDAPVRLFSTNFTADFVELWTTTDADGSFEFSGLDTSAYKIVLEGLTPAVHEADASQDQPVILKVQAGSHRSPSKDPSTGGRTSRSAFTTEATDAGDLTAHPDSASRQRLPLEEWAVSLDQPTDATGWVPAFAEVVVPTQDSAGMGTDLETHMYKVNPEKFARALDFVGPVEPTNGTARLKDFLAELGVEINPPKTIWYKDRTGLLFVRGTESDLHRIDDAIQELQVAASPPLLNVQARFVGLRRGLLESLGLDWFLTTPSTEGSATNVHGILNESQSEKLLAALHRMEGVELLSAPSLTTRNHQQAEIQITDIHTVVTGIRREALSPPGMFSSNGLAPQIYQTTNLASGPVLSVIPTLSADGYTIQLDVTARLSSFLGYADATNSVPVYVDGETTPQDVPLPQYFQSEARAQANVWDGQTLVLGGLMFKEAETQNDKVPVIGDLPLVGSLFRSERDAIRQSDVIVLVTPTLVDASGKRIHSSDETPLDPDEVSSQPSR